MIEITEKQNCCGCTACESICPKECIQMKADEEGFLYPVVDTEKNVFSVVLAIRFVLFRIR